MELQPILSHLDRLDKKLDEYNNNRSTQHLEVMTAVAELRTNMHALIGNGQPGRVGILERKMTDMLAFKNKTLGWSMAVASLVSIVLEAVAHYLFPPRVH